MHTSLWSILLVLVGCLIGSFAPILVKKGSIKKLLSVKSLLTNYHLQGGLGLYAIGTIIFIPALKGGDLSVLYPLVATTYIWVSFWSIKFLGEKMNIYKWLGILLILAGVSFIGLGA